MTDVPRTGPEPLGEGPRGRGPTVSTRPCPWPCGPRIGPVHSVYLVHSDHPFGKPYWGPPEGLGPPRTELPEPQPHPPLPSGFRPKGRRETLANGRPALLRRPGG